VSARIGDPDTLATGNFPALPAAQDFVQRLKLTRNLQIRFHVRERFVRLAVVVRGRVLVARGHFAVQRASRRICRFVMARQREMPFSQARVMFGGNEMIRFRVCRKLVMIHDLPFPPPGELLKFE
jgi:hypothetical protein